MMFQAWLAAAVLLAAPLAHVCAAPPPTLDSVAECVGAARNNHMALLPGADGGAGHLITNHCVSGDCGEPDYVLGPAGHHYWIVGNAADAAERDFNSCDTVPDTCFNGMHDSGEDSTDVGGVCPVPPCGGFFLDNAPGVVHGPVAGDNSACRGVVGAHAADARSSVYFIRVPEASVLTFEIDGWEGECIGSISGYDSQLSFFEGTTNVFHGEIPYTAYSGGSGCGRADRLVVEVPAGEHAVAVHGSNGAAGAFQLRWAVQAALGEQSDYNEASEDGSNYLPLDP